VEKCPSNMLLLLENKALETMKEASKRTSGRVQQFLTLTAYVEPPIPPTNLNQTTPLPLRTHTSDDLGKYEYPRVQKCPNLQANLPVDHPVSMDSIFGTNAARNVKSFYPNRFEYAKCCSPVDVDAFLPWIHDVFVGASGTHVEFIAHNKRRCRTHPAESLDDLANLEPQVALMQSVPVKRISESQVRKIAPRSMWSKHDQSSSNNNITYRYRLASLEDADDDAKETRFICRFHRLGLILDDTKEAQEVLGETLSVFPYNYEHNHHQKPGRHPMLTTPVDKNDIHGAHNEHIWNSVLHFQCPIPQEVQTIFEQSVEGDVPPIYMDLVPIRTRPRTSREGYFPQASHISSFRPDLEWGSANVLPTVEASGRWANIPVCRLPPSSRIVANNSSTSSRPPKHESPNKHKLIGCLWASASFQTRGNSNVDASNADRLLEWLAYHLYVAKFDHIYIYDNSRAHSNSSSSSSSTLENVIQLFPLDRVTRIDWPHRVCNNNRPSHANAGERSSQYAAESSCRIRYGPSADWMSFFDADEYFVAQGNWTSVKHWLTEGVEKKESERETHILSMFQSRALPNVEFMEPHFGGGSTGTGSLCGTSLEDSKCLAKRSNVTFLQAYDCESSPLPKSADKWRAKKQLFRPWYVLNHFVHYSTVTTRTLEFPKEVSPAFVQRGPFERRVDEINEAFMLHTKTTSPAATVRWKEKCTPQGLKDNKCPVGFAAPLLDFDSSTKKNGKREETHGLFNCYRHGRVEELVLKLNKIMAPIKERYHESQRN
jgi:hypothetical protein